MPSTTGSTDSRWLGFGARVTLIELPSRMTHASTADAPFAAPANLIRLSVGLESAEDLLLDLEQALVRSTAGAST